MALGTRDILFFFLGIIAVCLVISFSAYELTTYDAVRDAMGSISSQPSQIVDLHSQYNDMVDQFANGRGDVFTYHYGGQDIAIVASQAQGKSESQVMGFVLDKYTQNFYNGNVKGDYATISVFAGASANGLYFLATVLLFAAFIIIFVLSFIQQWYESTRDLLKSSGKIILVLAVVAFVVFLFMPSVAKSVLWSSINTPLGRDITYVVEPRITGTFLVNTLIVILFGALLYGAGFLIHINTGEGDPDPMEYVKSTPKIRSTESQPKPRDAPAARTTTGKPPRRQL